mmetsp:Transcript_35647/g.92930  ORF Transcript_35647/g.92930 Transcript_35647/m.92930 type:complete len:166 (+) Transcript_35647:155-652(+)
MYESQQLFSPALHTPHCTKHTDYYLPSLIFVPVSHPSWAKVKWEKRERKYFLLFCFSPLFLPFVYLFFRQHGYVSLLKRTFKSPLLPCGPSGVSSREGKRVMLATRLNRMVTKMKVPNLAKKVISGKKRKKVAPRVEMAPERTDTPTSVIISFTLPALVAWAERT